MVGEHKLTKTWITRHPKDGHSYSTRLGRFKDFSHQYSLVDRHYVKEKGVNGMRALLRTVLIIGITSLGVLAILALSRESNSPLAVDASIAQSIPG